LSSVFSQPWRKIKNCIQKLATVAVIQIHTGFMHQQSTSGNTFSERSTRASVRDHPACLHFLQGGSPALRFQSVLGKKYSMGSIFAVTLGRHGVRDPTKKQHLTNYVVTRWYRAPELLLNPGAANHRFGLARCPKARRRNR